MGRDDELAASISKDGARKSKDFLFYLSKVLGDVKEDRTHSF